MTRPKIVTSIIILTYTLLPLSAKAGAIVYDTICSNASYTIRGNMPGDTDVPHHFVWEVSSDGGATWTRVPNSNRQNLTLADFQVGMSDMSVQRRLYRRYFFSPHHVSESDIVGLVIAKGYRLSRTTDTITPCMDSKGFEITTPLPATFEWQCLESGKTLQPQTTTVTTSKYKVRVADLKTTDSEMPNGTYSLSLTIQESGECMERIPIQAVVNRATISPFNIAGGSFTYTGSDVLPLSKWGGPDQQQWTMPQQDAGNLTIDVDKGTLSGVRTTFLKNIFIEAVCADYPDAHYTLRLVENSREFTYTGAAQEINLPYGTYRMECYGAGGGVGYGGANPVGLGGYTSGVISLPLMQKLFVYVGEYGNGMSTVSGFNGGGRAFTTNGHNGGRGGGASDIRLLGGAWNDAAGLRSRIMVAGGGGGAMSNCGGNGATAGHGGGLTGTLSINQWGTYVNSTSYGGTQTTGGSFRIGSSCANNGVRGTFGTGGYANSCAAGGGGGYYGGASLYTTGGGGGSSFISGYLGCDAVNASGTHTGQPNHYSGLIFKGGTMSGGVRSGYGLVRITACDGCYYNSTTIGTQAVYYSGTEVTPNIPAEATHVRAYLIGASGGGGSWNANTYYSGAGGYTIVMFPVSKISRLGVITGQGGRVCGQNARTAAAYPNGGIGQGGDVCSGSGGGRSQLRDISSGTLIAIAGGGGGSAGFAAHSGAGGGYSGQPSDGGYSTGGTQTAGGGPRGGSYLQGAHANTNTGDDCGGGGDGYYGGGTTTGDGKPGAGGSGYVNYNICTEGYTYTGYYGTRPSEITATIAGYSTGVYGVGVISKASGQMPTVGNDGLVILEYLKIETNN